MAENDSTAILGELCALAPSTEVRDCLRLYKLKASYNYLEHSFNRITVGHLSETLVYLNASRKIKLENLTKEGLVRKLILRIHNLMAETCEFCNETYAVSKDANPLLPCQKCGQDVHPECLIAKLGLEAPTTNTEDAVNPLAIPGLTYLCPTCKEKTVSSDDNYLKQSVIKAAKKSSQEAPILVPSSSDSVSSNQTQENPIAQAEGLPSMAPNTNANESQSTSSITIPPSLSTSQITPTSSDVLNTASAPPQQTEPNQTTSGTNTTYTSHSQQGSNSQTNMPKSQVLPPSDPRSFDNLCPDYLVFKCKRRSECRLNHPRICYNFLDHGIKRPYGCNGKTCHELHPPMCKDSLKDMRCFDESCQLWHIRGTARKKRSELNNEHKQPALGNQPAPSSQIQNQTQTNNELSIKPNITSDVSSFLDQVRLLKSELLEVLDLRFATLKSELQPKLQANGSLEGNQATSTTIPGSHQQWQPIQQQLQTQPQNPQIKPQQQQPHQQQSHQLQSLQPPHPQYQLQKQQPCQTQQPQQQYLLKQQQHLAYQPQSQPQLLTQQSQQTQQLQIRGNSHQPQDIWNQNLNHQPMQAQRPMTQFQMPQVQPQGQLQIHQPAYTPQIYQPPSNPTQALYQQPANSTQVLMQNQIPIHSTQELNYSTLPIQFNQNQYQQLNNQPHMMQAPKQTIQMC